MARIKSLTVDDEDNIWCSMSGGYAVFNGKRWIIDDSTFRESSVFTIKQATDKRIWLGTGDGIYINDL
jgi:ligand-binding sensor domain-containing protein